MSAVRASPLSQGGDRDRDRATQGAVEVQGWKAGDAAGDGAGTADGGGAEGTEWGLIGPRDRGPGFLLHPPSSNLTVGWGPQGCQRSGQPWTRWLPAPRQAHLPLKQPTDLLSLSLHCRRSGDNSRTLRVTAESQDSIVPDSHLAGSLR